MPRRIAFVIQHINALGGTERAACAVMNGLADYASIHLAEVHSLGPAGFGLDARIHTHALFRKHVSLLNRWPQLVARLAAWLRRNRIETLVVVESTHALYAVPAAKIAGCRVVVWEHFNFRADLGKRKRRWGRRIAARFADDVVVLTHRDIDLWRHGARTCARLTCIPNIAPPLSTVPYDSTSRRVLALGRLSWQKGFDRLLDAWRIVEQDPRGSGWRLAVYGDGPDRQRLLKQAATLERAAIEAARADVSELLAEAGLLAASSRLEGLPMVLLEAAAHGIPAVAFDCVTGPSEIIAPHHSGLLVPEGDIAALAEAILTVMADASWRQQLSTGAKEQAARFGRSSVRARWCALLGLPAPPAVESEHHEETIQHCGDVEGP